jgi:hypothetical protein
MPGLYDEKKSPLPIHGVLIALRVTTTARRTQARWAHFNAEAIVSLESTAQAAG